MVSYMLHWPFDNNLVEENMKCFALLTLPGQSIILPTSSETPSQMNSSRLRLLHLHCITPSGTYARAADVGEVPQRCSTETCIP